MNQTVRKCLALLGSGLMFLVIGIPYSWGVISVYVRQYFNEVENLNMTQSEVNIIFPITFGTFFLGINVGPFVKN